VIAVLGKAVQNYGQVMTKLCKIPEERHLKDTVAEALYLATCN
jgi:hypothetical protein